MDNVSHYKSKKMRDFIDNREEIKPLFLPRYAPELNKVENINRKVKRDINTNIRYKNKKELKSATKKYLKKLSLDISET
jgi:transposase